MNPSDFRLLPVTPDLREAYSATRADVYLRGENVPENEPDWEIAADRYVALVGGHAVGSSVVMNYQFTRGEATLPAGGVAAVGVRPEYRHQHHGSRMMVELLYRMREQGMVVAALYAFRELFYRKFGYEVAGKRFSIKCPSHRMPNLAQDLDPRRIMAHELTELDACYTAFARQHSGANLRTPAHWRVRMGKRAPMIYAFGDPIEGYCWTSMEGGFWEDLHFGEVIWSTPRGYRNCLAFMRGLCINRSAATWLEPSPSPFFYQYLDHDVSMEEDRTSMYRVLDVPGFLRLLKPSGTGSFSIKVQDDQVPENCGPWRVDFEPGRVEVRPTDLAEMACSIQTFSQAAMGEPGLPTLMAFGLLECNAPLALLEAQKLLTPSSVFCTEFF